MEPTEAELIEMTLEERCNHAPYKIWIPNELIPFKEWSLEYNEPYRYFIKWNSGTYLISGVKNLEGKTEECTLCVPHSF